MSRWRRTKAQACVLIKEMQRERERERERQTRRGRENLVCAHSKSLSERRGENYLA